MMYLDFKQEWPQEEGLYLAKCQKHPGPVMLWMDSSCYEMHSIAAHNIKPITETMWNCSMYDSKYEFAQIGSPRESIEFHTGIY